MNAVDLLLIGILVVAIIDGIRRGLLVQLFELVGLVAAIILALTFYRPLADWLIEHYHTPILIAKPAAFLGIWLAVEVLLSLAFHLITRFVPDQLKQSFWNRMTGIVPSVLKVGAITGIVATMLVSLPIGGPVKATIEQSKGAENLMLATSGLTGWLEKALGKPFSDTFNFLTTPSGDLHNAVVTIPKILNATKLKSEPELEARMLELVNAERHQAGLQLLVSDPELREVARAHSRDMWLRGYFAHVNPDGQDPFARMKAAGITYQSAGENLALAPTLTIAHEGLMRSPSHRANILEPSYGRLGIGIISAGSEGLMVTQNFRD